MRLIQGIPLVWLAVGFGGQLCFSARFLFQWLISERRRKSVIPEAFWWFSVLGGLLLLAYALHRRDPVFTVGQLTGLLVYTRNLALIHRRRSATSRAHHSAK